MRTLRIYSLNNFPVHPTAVWAVCACSSVGSLCWCNVSTFLLHVCLGVELLDLLVQSRTVFQNGCTHLHYKLYVRILVAPHPPRFNHFSECVEVLHCDDSIFLRSNEGERISIGLLNIGIPFSVKLLF